MKRSTNVSGSLGFAFELAHLSHFAAIPLTNATGLQTAIAFNRTNIFEMIHLEFDSCILGKPAAGF